MYRTSNKTQTKWMKLIATALSGLLLVGCATLYDIGSKIPGLDRILHENSKAEVGPVKTAEGEIIAGTEVTASKPIPLEEAEPKTESPVTTLTPAQSPTQNVPESVTETKKPQVNQSKPTEKLSSVTGKITLLTKSGEISAQGVIVRLKRVDGLALASKLPANDHSIHMRNKEYSPGQHVIQKGDVVNFINEDNIQHNVFSSSGENAFDLGTYGSGLERGVRLNEDGIVKVYCNIHPDMATYIAVDDAGISHVISNDSTFAFNNLPATDYELTVWSIRGEKVTRFSLSAGTAKNLDIEFDTTEFEATKHVNKFGNDYEKTNKKSYQKEIF